MTRQELQDQVEEIVKETAEVQRKDRDRLVDAITAFAIEEWGVEVDDEDEEPEDEDLEDDV